MGLFDNYRHGKKKRKERKEGRKKHSGCTRYQRGGGGVVAKYELPPAQPFILKQTKKMTFRFLEIKAVLSERFETIT